MLRYVLIFKADQALDWTSLPPEEAQRRAGAWGSWIASMGSAVEAADAFKFGGQRVTTDGNQAADNLLTGYVVVEAENYDEATKLAAGAPYVTAGDGSIEVYEILPTRH